MDILSNLANLLGQGAQKGAAPQQGAQAADGLGGLFSPDVLGGLVGSLLGGKSGAAPQAGGMGELGSLLGSLLGGAHGAGAGAAPAAPAAPRAPSGAAAGGGLASILGSLMGAEEAPPPAPMAKEPTVDNKAINLLRALIYAVKADGKIDREEEQAINEQVRKLGLGAQAQTLVDKFLAEPLDPNKIAQNITSSDEALNIYALSCAITKMDDPAERKYLDSLANAMQIPMSIRQELVRRILG